MGTNYIANLIIGSTWSYVTGGPEFTNQPPASTTIALGGSGSITGAGATAAGQTVSYQWVKITNGGATPITSTNGPGGAGGSATVSGANTATLTLTGISAGDAGNYQLVATASGTGYTLNSATAAVVLPDPLITANPANATANYGQTATFTATATTGNAPLHYGWYFNGTTASEWDAAGRLAGRGRQRHRNYRRQFPIYYHPDSKQRLITWPPAATTSL